MSQSPKAKYYIAVGQRTSGPFDLLEVRRRVLSAQLGLMDLVFDPDSSAWLPAVQVLSFEENLAQAMNEPPSAPSPTQNNRRSHDQSTSNTSPRAEFAKQKTPQYVHPSQKQASGQRDPNTASSNAKKIETEKPQDLTETHIDPKERALRADIEKTLSDTATATQVDDSLALTQEQKDKIRSKQRLWYLRQGKTSVGPYDYLTIMMLFRDHTVSPGDHVREKGSETWVDAYLAFTKEERQVFAQLIPAKPELHAPDKSSNRRNEDRVAFDLLMQASISINDKLKDTIVMGYDISTTHATFVCVSPVFVVGQGVILKAQLPFGKTFDASGVIEKISEVPAQTVTQHLFKFLMQFDETFDISLFDASG